MRPRRWWLPATGVMVVLAAMAYYTFRPSPRPRNVLLITLDTTRADHLGCYGHAAAHTPTIDALAAGGVVFDAAYVTVPLTLPSHTSMLTGLYPPENGIHLNGQGRLDPKLPNLAESLRQQGYRTGAFIASVVLHSMHGLNHGFDVYDDDMAGGEQHGHESHLMRNARQVVDSALAWLQGQDDRPFFCWVHLFDPHAPYEGHPEVFGDRFQNAPYDGDIAFA
ncbi:MAG: sulfatase, partial [Planctomycetaceae bacterium]|nr:sulfatase [Planctomycetaceae bacterium]